jgi:hypothetical protein
MTISTRRNFYIQVLQNARKAAIRVTFYVNALQTLSDPQAAYSSILSSAQGNAAKDRKACGRSNGMHVSLVTSTRFSSK